ncbi:MAG: hypothetical protein N838_12565 [Thiohalocapsa sp. PB-PSB1]|nr:MAG: hypothetical protein N838_27995 [Thiohalocapsa sp. PB-PSB1]QQO54057.1 MAG: hypothetical protein N838_12565 [Thiohalocapsa sp. PB-PSB1]
MKDTDRKVDSLPDAFASEDEAAEFWDTHSLADYEEFLEAVDLDVSIERRHFEIEVDRQSFLALRQSAEKQRRPIKDLASEILKRELMKA